MIQGDIVSKETEVLADLKDLIKTLHDKPKELKSNNDLKAMWIAKRQRVEKAIESMGSQEYKKVEMEYSEWIRQEFPDFQRTKRTQNPFPPTP